MKEYFKKLILFTAPLTVLAFCLVTTRGINLCGDIHAACVFPFYWTVPGATEIGFF